MKIMVCIKHAMTVGDDIDFAPDGGDVDPALLEGSLNEWDAAALEEAVLIREKQAPEAQVIAVTVGAEPVEASLRQCLARGADHAMRVDGLNRQDPIAVASALGDVARQLQPDLIFCGVQSSDWAQAATGSAIAGFLDWPLVAVVRELRLDPQTRSARATRELEGGRLDVVESDLPAVLSIQTGINAPRYATLRAIKQAERRELQVIPAPPAPEFGHCDRRMYLPSKGAGAQMLGTDPAQVAAKVVEIIKGALK
jgi:electron transfer flavoprotein beta subunit